MLRYSVAILLLGCSGAQGVAIDPAFSPDDRADIVRGIDSWGGRFYVDDRGEVTIAMVDPMPYGDHTGYTHGKHIDIRMPLPPECPLHTIVAHELGHVLDLPHQSGMRTSVMIPDCLLMAEWPTEADLADAS